MSAKHLPVPYLKFIDHLHIYGKCQQITLLIYQYPPVPTGLSQSQSQSQPLSVLKLRLRLAWLSYVGCVLACFGAH